MKGIEQTLAEQLDITDREIEHRKALLSFTSKDADVLSAHKPLFAKYLDNIVKDFYEHQIEVTEISLLIGDAETLRRLQNAMRTYILELFEGYYDAEYVNKRLRIGKVHMRIGVSPKLYISAIYLLQQILKEVVLSHYAVDEHENDVSELFAALNKLMMFDIQLVFDTYIHSLVSEVNTAKDELESYTQSLKQTVEERTRQLEELSRRDELSNLFNQRGFREHLRRELSNAVRYREPISLMYLDLNCFKDLNDGEGHQAGDDVIKHMGAAISNSIRDTDIGCRCGGDEFCIILPRTSIAETRVISDRIVEYFKLNKVSKEITFSVGISSTGPEEFCDADTLVKAADKLMYKAKEKSRRRNGFYIETQS